MNIYETANFLATELKAETQSGKSLTGVTIETDIHKRLTDSIPFVLIDINNPSYLVTNPRGIVIEYSHNPDLFCVVAANRPDWHEYKQNAVELGEKVIKALGEIDDYRYIINIGSVGQPRDGDNNAKYIILDTEKNSIEVKFIPYDIASVVNKIIEAGLPTEHAIRLL